MVPAVLGGHGVGLQHRVTGSESSVPVVGMDFFFITKESIKRRDTLAVELDEKGDEAISKARVAGLLI